MRNPELTEALLALAKRPDGVQTDQVPGYTVQFVSNWTQYLADRLKEPMLFRAKLGHRTVKFFDSLERAAAYQETHRKRGSGSIAYQPPSKRRCSFAIDDEAVTTAKTKYTPAKAIPERFAADGPIVGGFATARIGEYDMPASRWVEAVA